MMHKERKAATTSLQSPYIVTTDDEEYKDFWNRGINKKEKRIKRHSIFLSTQIKPDFHMS